MRQFLFRSAIVIMAMDFATYIFGFIAVNVISSVNAKIRAGAWFFLVGSALSLLAFILSFFGHGKQRVGLAIASVLALPFWFGFTLY